MTHDPFEQLGEIIDVVEDTAEAEEAKREKRAIAKFYFCDVAKTFNTQSELREFLESIGDIPANMTIIKGHHISPKKKVVYSI
jgi:hypothetical protein